MAEGIPARLTREEGRKFGLSVGGAFLALAALFWWRGRAAGALVCGGLGALLVLAGLAAPTGLGPVQRAWMGFGYLLSRVTTPIFMGIVYFVVLTPIGAIMRVFGRNGIRRQPVGGSHWIARPPASRRGDMGHQF